MPQANDGGLAVQLCNRATTTEVEGRKPGQRMSPAEAPALTREWQHKHPGWHR